jgi:hypothetical protein
MLVLPTGQVLFSDGGAQIWAYTPDGAPDPARLPVINSVVYNGGGLFTLTGTQLNGQSSGAALWTTPRAQRNILAIAILFGVADSNSALRSPGNDRLLRDKCAWSAQDENALLLDDDKPRSDDRTVSQQSFGGR